MTRARDPTIAWGADQIGLSGYVNALSSLASGGALANATFTTAVLQLTDRAFPVIAPLGGLCWLTSLAVTYGRAARDEVARELGGAEAAMFNSLSYLSEGILRLSRADHCVFPNHLLFSTSLYGDWTGNELPSALDALRHAFPDRAIVWRSLNQEDNAPLVQRMLKLGGRRLLSRIVWRLTDVARDWAPRRDVRDDRRLVAARNVRVETARNISTDDLRRVIALYGDLYRTKYSQTNPGYTDALLRAAIESSVIALRLVRSETSVIEAFTAEHVYQGALINPLIGYDRTLPRSRGLYRIAMAVSGEHALNERLVVNYSAGAAAFKRNRGARPALEFSMVFDDHLPAWRRLAYKGLASALDALAPSLERIALR